jgi:hypothetical protein
MGPGAVEAVPADENLVWFPEYVSGFFREERKNCVLSLFKKIKHRRLKRVHSKRSRKELDGAGLSRYGGFHGGSPRWITRGTPMTLDTPMGPGDFHFFGCSGHHALQLRVKMPMTQSMEDWDFSGDGLAGIGLEVILRCSG